MTPRPAGPLPARRILIADDDSAVRGVVKRYVGSNGFSPATADNGSDALMLIRESRPDIVLLGAEMPGLDGLAVCRVLKRDAPSRQIPVILMSGKLIQDRDVLEGLEGGADDYVIKPLSLPVLLARLRVVLRRYETSSGMESRLKKAGIVLDPGARTVTVQGSPVALTRKEFDLLAALISGAGRVLSVLQLLERVWGYDPADYNDPGTVETHVSHLRTKLGPKASKHIVTVIGHGYRFEG